MMLRGESSEKRVLARKWKWTSSSRFLRYSAVYTEPNQTEPNTTNRTFWTKPSPVPNQCTTNSKNAHLLPTFFKPWQLLKPSLQRYIFANSINSTYCRNRRDGALGTDTSVWEMIVRMICKCLVVRVGTEESCSVAVVEYTYFGISCTIW